MKNLVISLLALFFLISCTKDDEVLEIPHDTDSITVLSYLIASDNGLNHDLFLNIVTMYYGLASMDKPATLLIYWDGDTRIAGKTHLILKYETDGRGNINGRRALDIDADVSDILDEAQVVKDYDSQICTDKEVMKKVLYDMKAYAPTDKLGLIVGSHGSSWLNSINTTGRAIGFDDEQVNSIQLSDMVEVLQSLGNKFEFILFDACFMGSIEVCYEFYPVADYLITSVMEVPAEGFPYDMFMNDLCKGNVEGYKKVCEAFIDYYQKKDDKYKRGEKGGESRWGTVSLINCKEIPLLTEIIKEELVTHKEKLSLYDETVLQEYGRAGGYGIAYDLEHFIKDLNGNIIPESFKTQLKKTVLYTNALYEASYSREKKNKNGEYEYHKYDVDASNYCGLGLYIPIKEYPMWNTFFKTIDWYKASGWSEVIFSWNF